MSEAPNKIFFKAQVAYMFPLRVVRNLLVSSYSDLVTRAEANIKSVTAKVNASHQRYEKPGELLLNWEPGLPGAPEGAETESVGLINERGQAESIMVVIIGSDGLQRTWTREAFAEQPLAVMDEIVNAIWEPGQEDGDAQP